MGVTQLLRGNFLDIYTRVTRQPSYARLTHVARSNLVIESIRGELLPSVCSILFPQMDI